jgi:hypothetical protein
LTAVEEHAEHPHPPAVEPSRVPPPEAPPENPLAAATGATDAAPHGDDHVHLYVDSGITEGNARVPPWLLGVILLLFGFFGWYVVTQWKAQPNTAQAREK